MEPLLIATLVSCGISALFWYLLLGNLLWSLKFKEKIIYRNLLGKYEAIWIDGYGASWRDIVVVYRLIKVIKNRDIPAQLLTWPRGAYAFVFYNFFIQFFLLISIMLCTLLIDFKFL